jgi:hypothetical protein
MRGVCADKYTGTPRANSQGPSGEPLPNSLSHHSLL